MSGRASFVLEFEPFEEGEIREEEERGKVDSGEEVGEVGESSLEEGEIRDAEVDVSEGHVADEHVERQTTPTPTVPSPEPSLGNVSSSVSEQWLEPESESVPSSLPTEESAPEQPGHRLDDPAPVLATLESIAEEGAEEGSIPDLDPEHEAEPELEHALEEPEHEPFPASKPAPVTMATTATAFPINVSPSSSPAAPTVPTATPSPGPNTFPSTGTNPQTNSDSLDACRAELAHLESVWSDFRAAGAAFSKGLNASLAVLGAGIDTWVSHSSPTDSRHACFSNLASGADTAVAELKAQAARLARANELLGVRNS
jgi:hypothetical protein